MIAENTFTSENGGKTKKIEVGFGVEYISPTRKIIRDFSESKYETLLYQQWQGNLSDILVEKHLQNQIF